MAADAAQHDFIPFQWRRSRGGWLIREPRAVAGPAVGWRGGRATGAADESQPSLALWHQPAAAICFGPFHCNWEPVKPAIQHSCCLLQQVLSPGCRESLTRRCIRSDVRGRVLAKDSLPYLHSTANNLQSLITVCVSQLREGGEAKTGARSCGSCDHVTCV